MRKLLVVVDMQKDFVDGALGTKEAQAIVPAVVAKMKAHEGFMICTRDTHGDNYLDTQEGKNLPVVHCIKESAGWELIEPVQDIVEERRIMVINKPGFGSMDAAGYMAALYDGGQIEEVELIGLCTDICVIINALVMKAMRPELKVTVDSACCAGVTKESHENALAAMKMCQVQVL